MMPTTPPKNPLLLAAKLRSPALVLSLLSHRISPAPNLDEADEERMTTLSYILQPSGHASRSEMAEAIEPLLLRGAKIDYLAPDLSVHPTWTQDGYRHPNAHIAYLAIAAGEKLGFPVLSRFSPSRLKALSAEHPLMHKAAAKDALWAVKLLLDAGADPNIEIRDSREWEGFPIAHAHSAEMLRMLSDGGASLSAPDSHGKTALDRLSSNSVSRDILLVAAEIAEKKAISAAGISSRGIAKSKLPSEVIQPLAEALFQAVGAKNRDKTKSLWKIIGRKNAIAARDRLGRSLLTAAIEARDFPLAKTLLAAGQSVNEVDQRGVSPFIAFVTLSYSRSERDPRGVRRRDFWSRMQPTVDFSAKDASGRSVGELLWGLSFSQSDSSPTSMENFSKQLWGENFDLLSPTADGRCFLQRAAAQWLRKSQEFNYSVPAYSIAPFPSLLGKAIEDPRFSPEIAADIIDQFLGAPAKEYWEAGATGSRIRAREDIHQLFLSMLSREDILANAASISLIQQAAPSFQQAYSLIEAAVFSSENPLSSSAPRRASRSL